MIIYQFPPTGRFEDVLARAARRPLAEPAPRATDRFKLCGWLHGYAIYDGPTLIATFHGPDLKLPSRLLRLLREDAERGPEPPEAVRQMLRASVEAEGIS